MSSSDEVGLAVLERLRELDEVADLRFASVYKDFDSISDFERRDPPAPGIGHRVAGFACRPGPVTRQRPAPDRTQRPKSRPSPSRSETSATGSASGPAPWTMRSAVPAGHHRRDRHAPLVDQAGLDQRPVEARTALADHHAGAAGAQAGERGRQVHPPLAHGARPRRLPPDARRRSASASVVVQHQRARAVGRRRTAARPGRGRGWPVTTASRGGCPPRPAAIRAARRSSARRTGP